MLPNCCRRSWVSPFRIADYPFLPDPEPPSLIQHNPPSLQSYPYLPITYSQGNIPKSNIAPPPPSPLSKHSLPPKPISPNFAAAPLPPHAPHPPVSNKESQQHKTHPPSHPRSPSSHAEVAVKHMPTPSSSLSKHPFPPPLATAHNPPPPSSHLIY